MKNCKVDFENKQIVATKSFLKAAGIIGSPEYNELVSVRRDFGDYPVVQREITKKQGKKAYGNLTYKVMHEFIEAQEDEAVAPFVLTEFQRIQDLSKAYNASYAFVRKWFLNRYKDVFTEKAEA